MNDSCVSVLLPDDVRRARPLGRGLDVELDLSTFREVFAADILHVEENVFVVVEVAVMKKSTLPFAITNKQRVGRGITLLGAAVPRLFTHIRTHRS